MPRQQAADKWLQFAIAAIKERIVKVKINQTGALQSSVKGSVSVSDAEVTAVVQYLFYGIFPDMGVGNGVTMADATTAKLLGSKRRRKNWTRAIAAQRHRFAEIMQNEFADEGIREVLKMIPGKISLSV